MKNFSNIVQKELDEKQKNKSLKDEGERVG
jgi:hypothetical protein